MGENYPVSSLTQFYYLICQIIVSFCTLWTSGKRYYCLSLTLIRHCMKSNIYMYFTLIDSPGYEKMYSASTNASLVSGIKQTSPESQTSCLEGFHSTLDQFSPKMICFSFIGMYCTLLHVGVNFLPSFMSKAMIFSRCQTNLSENKKQTCCYVQ